MANKNIILCGFMGCGKTTVGRLLAKEKGMDFVDLDLYIEKQQQMTISKIFNKFGEPYFRQLEREAAITLSGLKSKVIAAGGGTLTFQENVDTFKKSGMIVLINSSLETIAERLKGDKTRPLLARPDKEKAMKELYEKRMPMYKAAADIIVDGNFSPKTVCKNIISAIKIYN